MNIFFNETEKKSYILFSNKGLKNLKNYKFLWRIKRPIVISELDPAFTRGRPSYYTKEFRYFIQHFQFQGAVQSAKEQRKFPWLQTVSVRKVESNVAIWEKRKPKKFRAAADCSRQGALFLKWKDEKERGDKKEPFPGQRRSEKKEKKTSFPGAFLEGNFLGAGCNTKLGTKRKKLFKGTVHTFLKIEPQGLHDVRKRRHFKEKDLKTVFKNKNNLRLTIWKNKEGFKICRRPNFVF